MSHTLRRRRLSASLRIVPAALVLVAVFATTVRAQIPLGVDDDQWMLVEINGAPAGYLHTVVSKRTDGAWTTFVDSRWRVARMGQELELVSEQSFVEDGRGHVLELGSRLLLPEERVVTGRVDDDHLALSVRDPRSERTVDDVEWDARIRGPAWWRRATDAWLVDARAGDSMHTYIFDPSLGRPVTTTLRVEQRDEQGLRVSEALDILPGPPTVYVLDTALHSQGSTSPLMGLDIRQRPCSRSEALAAYHAGGVPAEMFEQTLLRPDTPLPRPRSLDRVIYRLVSRDGVFPLPVFDDGRQRVLERTPDSVLLEVRRVVPGDAVREVDDGDGSDPRYLRPNASIQCDDPKVVALARELGGDDGAPWDVARRLERGVARYIDKKSFGVAFGSASEVCANRSGDCTEHAVLLAAVCRARGIPSRVAMGIVYLGGIFGGHAWTEVWIDGHWFALDAVFGTGSVDATHIRFGASALDGVGMGPEMLGALTGIGTFDMQIVETEVCGVVRRPGVDDASAFTLEGRRLTSRVYGFTVSAPEGFDWSHETPDWTTGLVARALGPEGRVLSVRARAVGYEVGSDDLGDELGGRGDVRIPTRVDGRPALIGDLDGWVLGVLDGDTLLSFTLSGADEDDALESLTALGKTLVFTP